VERLSHAGGVAVDRCSSVYETEPVGEMPDQPDFLNAVV
jgi:7,8-dihydro-6-hydroxymethylpterin-pyrophosphokinase